MRVLPQRCSPLRRVLGVAPAGAVQRKDRGGGFLERRYAPSVATLGERVTACPRELAVDQRHVTRFSQRHDRVAAEPERPGVPRITSRCTQRRAPEGSTCRYRPLPSQ